MTRVSVVPASRFTRLTATATTSSLAYNAMDSSTPIVLAKSYRLLSIQCSRPARVRLYDTAAHQSADASRALGVDPVGDAGCVFEFYAIDTATHTLSPLVDGASQEATPSSSIAMTVTNMDSSTGTVVVTLTYLPRE